MHRDRGVGHREHVLGHMDKWVVHRDRGVGHREHVLGHRDKWLGTWIQGRA